VESVLFVPLNNFLAGGVSDFKERMPIFAKNTENRLLIPKNLAIERSMAILFLYHKDVRFQIQGFTSFISDTNLDLEGQWDTISTAIEDTFTLLKSFGINHKTLGGYNVTLPVL